MKIFKIMDFMRKRQKRYLLHLGNSDYFYMSCTKKI